MANGIKWWYKAEAVQLASEPLDDLEIEKSLATAKAGDFVVLAPDYASYSDASSGPLSLGQVGTIISVSGERMCCSPLSGGTEWWYVTTWGLGPAPRAPSMLGKKWLKPLAPSLSPPLA